MLNLNPTNLKKTQDLYLRKKDDLGLYYPIARFVLNLLGFVSAGFVGLAARQYASGVWPGWVVLLGAGAYAYLTFVATITGGKHKLRLLVAAGWGLVAGLFMPWEDPIGLALVLVVLIGTSMIAYGRLHHAKVSHAAVRPFTLARSYASTIVTGLALVVIALYAPGVISGDPLVRRSMIQPLSDRIIQILPTFIPGFLDGGGDGKPSLSEIATDAARRQLEADPRFLLLNPGEQAKALQEAATSAVGSLASQVGGALVPDTPIDEIAVKASNGLLDSLRTKYGIWFVSLWLLTVFFLVRSAGVIVTFIAAGVSWITVTTALSLGLLQIKSVPSTREEISL